MSDSPQQPAYLSVEEIKKLLESYCNEESSRITPYDGRKAAVLIPLYEEGGEWYVLFTRRSEGVNDHKGQVSFPGGGVEQEDRNVYRAALREAHEEIGLAESEVEILGRLKDYQTISNYVIAPIVAKIRYPFSVQVNHEEVSRVFTVPLRFLGNPENIEIRHYTLQNGLETRLFYFKTYDGELVWGITARIMVRLLKVLGFLEGDF